MQRLSAVLSKLTNLQNLGARVTVLGDVNDPVYAYMNPSIAYDGAGKLRINIRSCNFGVHPEGEFYYREGLYSKTRNLYGYLDPKTLDITELKQLKYSSDTPGEIPHSGLEDARLYWRKDGMHFVGARIDRRPEYRYPPQQCHFVYDEKAQELKYLGTMLARSPARGEKNWMPPDIATKEFDYNYSPTEVYKDGKLQGIPYDGFLHGSSQMLWQPKSKTYLAVLHSKHHNPLIVGRVYDKMIYVHYFAEYTKQGILSRISEAFTFGLQDNIEFVAGMVEYDGRLLMSMGVGDARIGFAMIDKTKAIAMLKPYDGTEASPLPPITRPQQRFIEIQTHALWRGR